MSPLQHLPQHESSVFIRASPFISVGLLRVLRVSVVSFSVVNLVPNPIAHCPNFCSAFGFSERRSDFYGGGIIFSDPSRSRTAIRA